MSIRIFSDPSTPFSPFANLSFPTFCQLVLVSFERFFFDVFSQRNDAFFTLESSRQGIWIFESCSVFSALFRTRVMRVKKAKRGKVVFKEGLPLPTDTEKRVSESRMNETGCASILPMFFYVIVICILSVCKLWNSNIKNSSS